MRCCRLQKRKSNNANFNFLKITTMKKVKVFIAMIAGTGWTYHLELYPRRNGKQTRHLPLFGRRNRHAACHGRKVWSAGSCI